ncbi:uncharacterized protein GLRG_01633 [Colletotrichum graminicola M1.001]|uniref:Uncharacterized protein n=1 Tax=Colletotrichum graminicola (strain M1.001 / M2 / FGSC 10212) TaxID=645133 RepID=E3Q6P1_COLGM|nr:uncharacterized protein GLRG_01633 [Colletotrichum graminicola M1.001]EFQ26489.1 hypothetical protein GLRG_01633 [Colletotrichum graminicola M1.001]
MPPGPAVFAQPEAYPGHRIIQPHDMTAIPVYHDTVVIAIEQQGKSKDVRVPKVTIGYMVIPDPQRPTHILARLKIKSGNIASGRFIHRDLTIPFN